MREYLNSSTKLLRVSLQPNKKSHGHISTYSDADISGLITKEDLVDEITVSLSGVACEEVMFGSYGIGGASDIERATHIAHDMVVKYGMGSLGPVNMDSNNHTISRFVSVEHGKYIDDDIREIVNNAFERSKDYLKKNQDLVVLLRDKLLEETHILGSDLSKMIRDYSTNNLI